MKDLSKCDGFCTGAKYAGIGSRKTPQDVLERFYRISGVLEYYGYDLRSGGAEGADKAFAQGILYRSRKQIFRPNHATEEALSLAATVHPAWERCDDYAKKLHARNMQIILGEYLNEPVEFVICWTDASTGGTLTAIEIAKRNKIPVYNFFIWEEEKAFQDFWTVKRKEIENKVREQNGF